MPGIAGDGDDGADRDDASPSVAHHRAERGAAEPERRRQVDGDDLVPVGVGNPDEQRVAGQAGIVDEDVYFPHRRLGLRHQLLDRGAVGEIARNDMDAVAELAGEMLQHLAAGARNRHGRALPVEGAGDAAADAAGRAGYQCPLAAQFEHAVPSSVAVR